MVSVGIDVSKEKSMVCMMKPYGEVLAAPCEVLHTEEGLAQLIEQILSIDDDVKVILEATGIYHLSVLTKLKGANVFVCVVNPLVMKKYVSNTLRKGKTDKLDSVKIANYGIDHWYRLVDYQPNVADYEELKVLNRQYDHYVKIKILCKQSLENILTRVMPGIKTVIRSERSDDFTKNKLCDFVNKYLHFDNITKMSENAFVKSYCKWAKEKGYHANETKAHKIYALAKAGIPTLPSCAASTKMLTQEAVRVLSETNKTLQKIISQMQEIAIGFDEYTTVRTMSGVGDILAVRLIAEIGDIRYFHSSGALIAYAGIDSPPFESGAYVGTKRNISKRGSSALRKVGYEIMQALKKVKPKEDSAVYEYMLKKEAEGKPKKVAKIAALNKFFRIYYARVREVNNV